MHLTQLIASQTRMLTWKSGCRDFRPTHPAGETHRYCFLFTKQSELANAAVYHSGESLPITLGILNDMHHEHSIFDFVI